MGYLDPEHSVLCRSMVRKYGLLIVSSVFWRFVFVFQTTTVHTSETRHSRKGWNMSVTLVHE